MSPRMKGLLLAGLHLALVAGLGGKMLLDRIRCPRVWLKAAPVDPDMPIRGRYVSLQVEVPAPTAEFPDPLPEALLKRDPWRRIHRHPLAVHLAMEGHRLVAHPVGADEGSRPTVPASLPEAQRALPTEARTVTLDQALPFFIPEHLPDPSLRKAGEELWVEVTLPRRGPLRPIRLGVKRAEGFEVLP